MNILGGMLASAVLLVCGGCSTTNITNVTEVVDGSIVGAPLGNDAGDATVDATEPDAGDASSTSSGTNDSGDGGGGASDAGDAEDSGGGDDEDSSTVVDAASSDAAAPYACGASGAPLVDGGPCSVSFANDIFPKMLASGAWNCAFGAGCHGSASSAPSPVLTGLTTPAQFYAALANMRQPDNKDLPYVNPCSTDPSQSGFACNTYPTGAGAVCGNSMPADGPPMSSSDQQSIAKWVACGAPLN